ncbi:TPA: hypothetical protein QDB15_006419 [Burkholderia vietnamiensis]|uniref:hypothetical protein n=1 Tax=Burkholderia vietnamiensis TaxID=60552 RepID=UPI0007556E28|nr:hypothetical protein [Burkholderia vietnamiensis]KVS13677.1 hypothetical protein WK32_31555 [Burkholderia vietnamiensis]MCA8211979.1 hypothetical protein [Burkholderia vietnamiensis]HDR9102710.1 hypothetical protein [Burkholderia vietnamiensis]HDR9122526.1 hypothetical protein [Burkholderia vietnamiensis]HDR9172288.1 hypothetical protein [Burkholderia vietnamiensis]
MQQNNNKVRVDLNNPIFQQDLVSLGKDELRRVQATIGKLLKLTWQQLYVDKGLNWEKITSVEPPPGVNAIYSLRITQSSRALAYREEDWLRLLCIEPDHDAAYGKK